MEPWEEHAIKRPHLPERGDRLRGGPRDGLQNEKEALSVDVRADYVDRLTEAGLPAIEVGSFVSPRAVPQLADTGEVFGRIHRASGTRYPALVPNLQGLDRALAAGVREIAVFTAASETFNRHNINAGVDESIERFRPVVARASEEKIRVRGYVSTAFGCPYEGPISPEAVREVVHKLLDLPGGRDLDRGHDRRGDAGGRLRRHRDASTTRGSRAASWPCIFTTRAGPASPTSTRGSSAGSRRSIPPPAASAAAPTLRAPPATWRPRTCSTCSKASGSRPGSASPASSRRRGSSRPLWAAARPAGTSPRSGRRRRSRWEQSGTLS